MNFEPLALFLDRITAWRIPWGEVLVMHRNETVFRYRSGFLNLEEKTPIDEGRMMNIYSMTKIMTCAAALQLVEKGAMLLNDPISAYMPEYAEMNVKKELPGGGFELVKAERPITVRDLFTMTAGFTYDLNSPSMKEAVERTKGKVPTRAFAEALANEPLVFEPGTRWSYSLCHDVLAALVEVVDGRRFSEYIRDEITGPLGMIDTVFDLSDEQRSRLAPQYGFHEERGEAVRHDGNTYRIGTEFESGGAGLHSTVSDYALFLNALTNRGTSPEGVRILSPRTVDLMLSDHLTAATRPDYNWDHMKGYGYGLGVRTHVAPAESGSLSPVGEFGWAGAAGCMAIIDPVNQVTVMYGMHMLNSQEPYVHPRLRNIVYSCL